MPTATGPMPSPVGPRSAVSGPLPTTGGQVAVGEVVAAKAAAGLVVAPAMGRSTGTLPPVGEPGIRQGKAKKPGARKARTETAEIVVSKGKGRAGKPARKRHPVLITVGAVVVVAAGGLAAVAVPRVLHPAGPAHTISTPQRLLAYVQAPALAKGLGAQALRAEIVKKSDGEASHVVDAVYEDSSGPSGKSDPLIILFIGGNLSGSAKSFITSFTGMLSGSFVTAAGALGGEAACVPGVSGHPAECAWADDDTFGLVASPTLSAKALGAELRQVRPLVEHTVK